MSEEFQAWKTQTAQALERLAEAAPPELAAELEELCIELERVNADYRRLPKFLLKMTALAPLIPELKQYLPSTEKVEQWMKSERARRLSIIRKYARAYGEGKIVTKRMRAGALGLFFEYFALVESRPLGFPFYQKDIEPTLKVYDHTARADMEVIDEKEFATKYANSILVAIVHRVHGGEEEYFIEELSAKELLCSETGGDPETRRRGARGCRLGAGGRE